MSILSDKTEKEAIVKLARCIKYLDGLAYLQMTAEDDHDANIALRSINSIIETNGYELVQSRKGHIIRKIKRTHYGKRTV